MARRRKNGSFAGFLFAFLLLFIISLIILVWGITTYDSSKMQQTTEEDEDLEKDDNRQFGDIIKEQEDLEEQEEEKPEHTYQKTDSRRINGHICIWADLAHHFWAWAVIANGQRIHTARDRKHKTVERSTPPIRPKRFSKAMRAPFSPLSISSALVTPPARPT